MVFIDSTGNTVLYFDGVYNGCSEKIMDGVMPYLNGFISGQDTCIFTHGTTGSGKSTTMFGYDTEPGILFESVAYILQIKPITVSAIEIIGSDMYDVSSGNKKQFEKRNELTTKMIASNDDFQQMVEQVIAVRAQKATNQNKTSSRSHLVFLIKMEDKAIVFADLAGFESPKGKENIDETKFINSTLSALNHVLISLSRGETPAYTANSLTKLLKPYLQPNAKTLMLYHVVKNSVLKDLNYIKDIVATQKQKPKRPASNLLKSYHPSKKPFNEVPKNTIR